jgi:hypothetical protein
MFVHCVYFWLRHDLSEQEHARFIDGVTSLTTIESVRQAHVGTPASTDRPVIDRTYSYALVVVFDGDKGHDEYQGHPVHDAFRRGSADLWTQVKIYDFVT